MRRSFLVGLIPAVAFAAVTFGATKQAAAGPYVGVDLDLGTAFQNQVDFSAGGGVRVGYRFVIPRSYVWLQPEVGGHYMRFGFNAENITNHYDYAGTLNGGIRAGLTGIVQPNLFTHVGLGFLGYDLGGGRTTGDVTPQFDIGAGIDFKVWQGFTLGAQLAYNMAVVPSGTIAGQETAAKWMNFGIVAGFHFGEPAPRRTYVHYRY